MNMHPSYLIQSISSQGVDYNDLEKYKRILFCNRFALIHILSCFGQILIFTALGHWLFSFTIFLSAVFLSLIPYLNGKRLYKLSPWIALCVPNVAILCFSQAVGEYVGMRYLFLSSVGISFLIFPLEQSVNIIAGIAFTITCFFVDVALFKFLTVPPVISYFLPLYYSCLVSCFFISAFTFWNLHKTMVEAHLSANRKLEDEIEIRKRNEKELEGALEHLSFVSLNINGILWVSSYPNHELLYVSSSARRILGGDDINLAENLNCWIDFIHSDDRENVTKAFNKINERPYHIVYRIVRPCDQQIRWISDRGILIMNDDGERGKIIGMSIDITSQKENEERFEDQKRKVDQYSKVAALGEIAGGIAHEINNPLAIIDGLSFLATDLLRTNKYSATNLEDIFKRIRDAVERISRIANSMRLLVQGDQKGQFENVPIATLAEDTLSLCREKFEHLGVHLTYSTCSAEAELKYGQICQVVVHLLNNALDAALATAEPWVRLDIIDAGDGIEISITDSGMGIPKDLHNKIYQPFFTTKEVGKGAGLGLSVSTGIVHSHGGCIYLDEAAKNTKFVIWLPKIRKHSKRRILRAPEEETAIGN